MNVAVIRCSIFDTPCISMHENLIFNPILLGVKTVLFAKHHVAPE